MLGFRVYNNGDLSYLINSISLEEHSNKATLKNAYASDKIIKLLKKYLNEKDWGTGYRNLLLDIIAEYSDMFI